MARKAAHRGWVKKAEKSLVDRLRGLRKVVWIMPERIIASKREARGDATLVTGRHRVEVAHEGNSDWLIALADKRLRPAILLSSSVNHANSSAKFHMNLRGLSGKSEIPLCSSMGYGWSGARKTTVTGGMGHTLAGFRSLPIRQVIMYVKRVGYEIWIHYLWEKRPPIPFSPYATVVMREWGAAVASAEVYPEWVEGKPSVPSGLTL